MMCGAEVAVVGLSPSYWSHIPLFVADLDRDNLQLANGIPFLIRYKDSRDGKQHRQPCFFPVSKCTLVGTLVYVSACSTKFVLDDGTGLIDIVYWGGGGGSSSSSSSDQGIYALPPLTCDSSQSKHHPVFSVGDRVRVLGRLECISVSDQCQNIQTGATGTSNNQVEIRRGIFEIHATILQPLVASRAATHKATQQWKLNDAVRPNDNELNWEANHWIKTIQATAQPAADNNKNPLTCTSTGLRNANDVLQWLGPKIADDVHHRRQFPSADDALGSWRVFGVHCTCTCPYKDALLYCHCQATPEPLDPTMVYRDALLNILLQMERQHHQHEPKQQSSRDFRFLYRTMVHHPQLNQVAQRVVTDNNHSHNNHTAKMYQLVTNTFGALRKDGILYLLDERTDTYLLLSKTGVLEPYLKRAKGRRRQPWRRCLPVYLRQIPLARLQYLQRCLLATEEDDKVPA